MSNQEKAQHLNTLYDKIKEIEKRQRHINNEFDELQRQYNILEQELSKTVGQNITQKYYFIDTGRIVAITYKDKDVRPEVRVLNAEQR